MTPPELTALDVPIVEGLSERVFRRLQEAIVTKALAPGVRVPEGRLATQLGVSKTPVREALVRLQVLGLVEPSGTQGLKVVGASRQRMAEAYEVRAALEAQAAALAAERADGATTAKVVQAAEDSVQRQASQDPDPTGYYEGDRDFHAAVARASGNSMLAQQLADVTAVCWVRRQRDLDTVSFATSFAQDHLQIAAAISAGDAEQARSLMDRHIQAVRDALIRASERGTTPAPEQG